MNGFLKFVLDHPSIEIFIRRSEVSVQEVVVTMVHPRSLKKISQIVDSDVLCMSSLTDVEIQNTISEIMYKKLMEGVES